MSGSVVLLAKRKFNPRTLFANGEQGLWLDPSDMTREKAAWRRNLLTYSEQFGVTTGGWSKQGVTVTNNTDVDPNGQTTADTLLTTVGVSNPGAYQNVNLVAGQQYTFSVWLKAGTISSTKINCWGPGVGVFSAVDVSLTSNWQRFTHTFTSPVTGAGVYSISPEGFIVGTGKTVIVWGAQLELGSSASTYQPITDFSTEFKAAFPTHTLYQDSQGVTPCTAVGDPVGLILDQSRGGLANLGPEIVTNGGLSDATGWGVSGASPPSITGGQAVWSNSTGEIGWISPLTVGKWYKLEFDLVSYTSGTLAFRDGTTNTTIATAGAVAGRKTFLINATSNQIRFISFASATVTIDNISVREVPGNHAYQTTMTWKPTLVRIPSSGRRNLLTRTEEFDNAAWTTGGSSISPNVSATTDPLGTNTAEKLVENSALTRHEIYQSITAAATSYTVSVYAKAAERTRINVGFALGGSSVGSYFDLSNGTVISSDAGATGAITSIGNGWYRCSTTVTATAATYFYYVRLINSGTTVLYTGDGASGAYIWGAQVETGSSPSNYQKVVATTDVTESGVSDLWHLVFDGSDDSLVTNAVDFGSQSLQSKNIAKNSEDLAASTWTKTILTILPAAVTGPFSRPADVMYPTSSGSNRNVQFTTASTLGGYVTSVYAKNYGTNNYFLAFTRGAAPDAFFNLQTGQVTGVASGCSAFITNAGSGWWRCEFVYDVGSTSTRVHWFPTDAASGFTVTANGTDGIAVTGFQLEVGSRASSYDPTGTDEMTVIAGVRKLSDAASAVLVELSNDAASNNGAFALFAPRISGNTTIDWRSRGTATATTQDNQTTSPITAVVSTYSDISDDSAVIRRNGAQINSTSGDQGSGNFGNYALYIGRRGGSSLPYTGHLYQLIIRGKTTPTGKLLEAERFTAKKTGLSI